jgi:hypothetical protein
MFRKMFRNFYMYNYGKYQNGSLPKEGKNKRGMQGLRSSNPQAQSNVD